MIKRELNKRDYERYFFFIDIKNLFGKRRKQYIQEELEKRHPCYSEIFSYDAGVRINRKKIQLDVVVMNKLKLHDYKRKVPMSFLGFRLENEKSFLRFSDKKKVSFFSAVLFLIILIIFSFLKYGNKNKTIITEDVNEINVEDLPDIMTGEKSRKLFEMVDINKGKIRSLVWKTDGYFEEINITLHNIFPESLNEIRTNLNERILYENGNPTFTFNDKWKISKTAQKPFEEQQNINDFFRKAIIENGGKLLDETFFPARFSFMCKKDLKLVGVLSEILIANDVGVKEIRLIPSENDFSVELSFDTKFSNCQGIPVQILSEYSKLFYEETKTKVDKEKMTEKKENRNLTRVGVIGYEDGKKKVFYKNDVGKIVVLMEE